mmetsp:Transcript_28324/g.40584  ORF Transcript_28324/g.40584 Transcript_28324/m.40584 type:complete len:82 (+) Transcript_28324:176-421(+)
MAELAGLSLGCWALTRAWEPKGFVCAERILAFSEGRPENLNIASSSEERLQGCWGEEVGSKVSKGGGENETEGCAVAFKFP